MLNCGTLVEKRMKQHVKIIFATALLSFGSSRAFQLISFDGKPAHWASNTIEYFVGSSGSDDFESGCDGTGPCVSELQALTNSFNSWANVPKVNLDFIYKGQANVSTLGYDKKNNIVWVESGWTSQSFSPPTGALAVTVSTYRTSDNAILDSDISFNGQYFSWGVLDTESEMVGNVVDIENIATHEIGHLVGLDHSSEVYYEPSLELYNATMFYASGAGEIFRRTLAADDIAAVQHLYSQEESSPRIDRLGSSSFDIRGTYTVTTTIDGSNFGNTTAVTFLRPDGYGDINGKITHKTSTQLTVEFDLYGVASGTYDLKVGNSIEESERKPKAFTVVSNFSGTEKGYNSAYSSSGGGGGCSANPNSQAADVSLLITLALLFFTSLPKNLPSKKEI